MREFARYQVGDSRYAIDISLLFNVWARMRANNHHARAKLFMLWEQGVASSNPAAPTNQIKDLARVRKSERLQKGSGIPRWKLPIRSLVTARDGLGCCLAERVRPDCARIGS